MHLSSTRNQAWDYARGIGIVLVVYGHTLRGLEPPGIAALEGTWLGVSDFAVYTFHMPLFFLLAGMNALGRLDQPHFLRGKVGTILLPYAVWTLVQGSIHALFSASTNSTLNLRDVPQALLLMPYAQFWFLYVLFLCHVGGWLARGRTWIVCLAALIAYGIGVSVWLGFPTVALRFFLFYALGLVSAPYVARWLENGASLATLTVTGLLTAAAIYAARHAPGANYTGGPAALPAAILGSLLVLQLSAALARRGAAAWLKTLGVLAMPIYLLHIIAGSGSRIALLSIGIRDVALHLVVGMSAGLLLPTLAVRLARLAGTEMLLGMRTRLR